METQSSHENASRLKMVLLLALAAALAWSAFSLYRLGAGVWELVRLAAAEVSGPTNGDPWAALADIEGITWVSMIVWIALLPVLGKCLLILHKAPWGKDFSWSNGQWMDTDPMAMRPGSGLVLAEPLKESMTGYKVGLAVMGAIAMLALLAAAGSIDMPADGNALAPLDLVPLFGALLFASVVAYASASIFTRRVQFDDAGLCDANFFRSQRVAWSAVADFKLGDTSSAPTYGSDGAPSTSQASWLLKDLQGRSIMELSQSMGPQESLNALQRRVTSRSSPSGFAFLDIEAPAPTPKRANETKRPNESKRANEAKPASLARTSSAGTPRKKRQWTEPEKEAAREAARKAAKVRANPEPERQTKAVQSVQRVNRNTPIAVAISALVTLFLFVIPATHASYRALWFKFAAERVQGVVVEIPPNDTPLLVVEYREVNTNNIGPMRLRSFGSDFYADYKVGDKVGVLYDPEQPGMGSRLDLFMELWFSSILLWSLALVGAIVTAVLARGLKPRRGA